jgi:transposase-like protein
MIGAYNRDVSIRKALRKRRLAREIYHTWGKSEWEYYDNLHQFSKNKIHCSCPMCSTKTRNKGKRRAKASNYCRSLNYRRADLLRLIAMDEQMREEGYSSPRRHPKEWI